MFIKIKHKNVSKMVKLEEDLSYDALLEITRNKFQELADHSIFYMDNDGTFLEQDVIMEYIMEQNKKSEIVTLLVSYIDENTTGSASTMTFNEIVNSWVIDTPSPSTGSMSFNLLENDYDVVNSKKLPLPIENLPSKEFMSVEDWRQYINNNGGREIFATYDKEEMLPPHWRKKLVNICCTKLTEVYQLKVPESAKRNLASAIITLFPNLRDPAGECGYEAFYSKNNGGEGYICWRLRTVARILNKGVTKRKRKTNLENNESVPKKPLIIESQTEEAVDFLKNMKSDTNLESIGDMLKLSLEYRKSLGVDILNIFPRFLDMPILIDIDFQLRYPDAAADFENNFKNDVEKIFKIYLSSCANPRKDILCSEEWDKPTRAIIAILSMLPPTARTRNKVKNIGALEDRLIQFKNINTPLSEISQRKTTTQPILVAQGTNKDTITHYTILVDGQTISCPFLCSSVKAFELFFKCHYIINVEYDEVLKTFMEFMQVYYFKVDCGTVKLTPNQIDLRTKLSHM